MIHPHPKRDNCPKVVSFKGLDLGGEKLHLLFLSMDRNVPGLE